MSKLASLILISIFAMTFVLSGCEIYRSHPPDITSFTKPTEIHVSSEQYVMFPTDEITVFCQRVMEIHEHTQQIRPDGKISFEKIGDFCTKKARWPPEDKTSSPLPAGCVDRVFSRKSV